MSDLKDYIGNADEFPSLRNWDFFNHAGAAPLPKRVADAMRKYADDSESSGYLAGNRYARIAEVRDLAAGLINAHRDEIALLKNTAEGISTVARGIDWRAGDRIVTAAGEYPANVYPWMDVARRHGLELVMVPESTDAAGCRGVDIDEILREARHPRTRMVALSHVEFATGQRLDLARIGSLCRAQDKRFCVDAIQSLGALPVDVQAMQIDYLAAGAQKWLMGAEGSAIFYCRRDLLEETPPLLVGAVNVINMLDFGDYDYTLQPTAGRFECGTWNMAGLDALRAAMELLGSLRIEEISKRIRVLTDRLVEGLISKGYNVISPRENEQWSGIVSFKSPFHDHNAIVKRLRAEERTEIVVREGRLRASPHFYNTDDQIDRLIEHLPAH